MNKCGKCGVEIKENAKYCKSCGSGLSFSDKKARVMTREKRWVKPAVIAAVVVVIAAGGWMFKESRAGNQMGNQPMFSPNREASGRPAGAVPVNARDGEIRIELKTVDDGNAHFFAYRTGGKTVTFFLMKAANGSIRTAFDACMSCNHAKLGYRQEGGMVVCNNCGMGFKPEEIGKKTGGCNPIPIEPTTAGRMIVLKAGDLDAGVRYF